MEDVQIYYLKECYLTEEHKLHISDGMKRMYARRGGMSAEHRKHISNGMKRMWKLWKTYWAEGG